MQNLAQFPSTSKFIVITSTKFAMNNVTFVCALIIYNNNYSN